MTITAGMRVIDDTTFAEIIRILQEDPKIKLFQKLILSPRAEQGENPEEVKESEVKNGIQ